MGILQPKRKTMVSTGDRSAKIRTYNYPQGRVTDHRINLTLYNLGAVMNGDIREVIDALKFAENAEKNESWRIIVISPYQNIFKLLFKKIINKIVCFLSK